jgi:hypothetical protein
VQDAIVRERAITVPDIDRAHRWMTPFTGPRRRIDALSIGR